MVESKTVGELLRYYRARAHLSQAKLAKLVHSHKSYVSKVESGARFPSVEFIIRCEKELEVNGELLAAMGNDPGGRSRPFKRLEGELPPITGNFVGRGHESAAVREALAVPGGICAITGLGGAGKTTLALRHAYDVQDSFADGCLFVDLSASDASAAESTAVDALGRALVRLQVPEDRVPAHADDRALIYRERMRSRQVLIVLDNAVSAAQVQRFLPGEPRCRVIVTSRRRLNALDEARPVHLGMLSMAEAVDLFCSIAFPSDQQGVDIELVMRVVHRCAQLPLALRIAAARLRSGSPTAGLAALERRLADEAGRLVHLTDGERSVVAVFEASVEALDADARRLFLLLGSHPGRTFTASAVMALLDVSRLRAELLLSALHDASLIEQDQAERYRMHDLVRDFATMAGEDRLPHAERAAAVRRLMEAMLRTAVRADELISPQRYRPDWELGPTGQLAASISDMQSATEWFAAEWQNLVALCDAAEQVGLLDRCWQIAFVLRGYFFHAKHFDAWVATHRTALRAARRAGDRSAIVLTLTNLGTALFDGGDLDEADEYYREALDLARRLGDEHTEVTLLANRGWIAFYRRDCATAAADLRVAVQQYRRQGNQRNAAITQRGLSLALSGEQHHGEAVGVARHALSVFDGLQLALDAAMAANCIGWALYQAGDHAGAKAAYEDAVTRSELCGSEYEAARALVGLGNVAMAENQSEAAGQRWMAADRRRPGLDLVMVAEAGERDRWERQTE